MRQAFCITLLKVIDAKSALSASKAEPTTPTTPGKYIIVLVRRLKSILGLKPTIWAIFYAMKVCGQRLLYRAR